MKKLNAKSIFIFIAIGCLYFSGVAAIVYPMVSNIISLSSSKTVISDYVETVEKMDSSEIDAKIEKARLHNKNLAELIYDDGLERVLCGSDGVVCYVEIPSISVYLPVYYGTDESVLTKGCGLLENTSLPVGGESVHPVISGHTGLPSAEMFTKLDQMKAGDMFYIHVLDQTLAYKVFESVAVTPDNTKELYISKGKDYVTLLTCTPYGINDKRLLVRGERMPYYQENAVDASHSDSKDRSGSADDGLAEEIKHQTTVTAAIIIVAVILYIFALIWFISSLGDKNQTENTEGQDVTRKTD